MRIKSLKENEDWRRYGTYQLAPVSPLSYVKWMRELGRHVDRLRFKPDELEAHVWNKLKLFEVMKRREKTMFGRLYNQIAETDRECILLNGVVVIQLFEIMGIESQKPIEPKLIYRIGYDDAAAWYAQAFSPDSPTKSSIKWLIIVVNFSRDSTYELSHRIRTHGRVHIHH